MQYESELFQCIYTLEYDHRHQLYKQAQQLVQLGADIIITYQNKDCHLWLNLKCKSLQVSNLGIQVHSTDNCPDKSVTAMTMASPNPISE